jgi:hypothetical protein
VILATVTVMRGEVVAVSAVGRRSAVPPRRPDIAAGGTAELRAQDVATETFDKFSITVDTTSAGFVSTPHYLLQLEGLATEAPADPPALPRSWEEKVGGRIDFAAIKDWLSARRPVAFFVADPAPSSFRIVVLLEPRPGAGETGSTGGFFARLLGTDTVKTDPGATAVVRLRDFLNQRVDVEADWELQRKWKEWFAKLWRWRFAWIGIEV